MRNSIRFAVGALALGLAVCAAAEPHTSRERVSFDSAALRGTGTPVLGELRIPETGKDRLPAVLVLHTSAGAYHDSHSEAFIAVLNWARIATLWIEMFRDSSARPARRARSCRTPTAVCGISRASRIDPQRIGCAAFPRRRDGADHVVEEVTQESPAASTFAADLALYPACWWDQQFLQGRNSAYGAGNDRHVIGGRFTSSRARRTTTTSATAAVSSSPRYPRTCAALRRDRLSGRQPSVRRHLPLHAGVRQVLACRPRRMGRARGQPRGGRAGARVRGQVLRR